jgi:hypothetical protein
VEVKRDGARIVVDGVGISQERQQQIHALLDAEGQVALIPWRKRREVDTRLGEMDYFVGAHNAADRHLASDLVLLDTYGFQLDLTVAEQNPIAFFYDPMKLLVIDRNHLMVAQNLTGCQSKGAAGLELSLISFNRTDTNLRTLKILENGDGAAEPLGDPTDSSDGRRMKRVVTVAEVEPGDIHAGLDQAGQNLLGLARGADSAHYFGSAHVSNLHDGLQE